MTNTTVISNASGGTSTNVGPWFSVTKTTLQSTTTCVKINARVTLGASGASGSKIRVRHAVSTVSYTSALVGAQALIQGSEYVDLEQRADGSLDIERSSDVLVTGAGYHYCWVEMPTLASAATINVYLQELP